VKRLQNVVMSAEGVLIIAWDANTGEALEAGIVGDVIRAWQEPGIRPDVHQESKEALRRHWPVLADALDRLAVASLALHETHLEQEWGGGG
jgi:hypothetical protein